MKPEEIQSLMPIDEETAKIANEIVEEKDVDKIKNLINIFNINQQKKNIVRASKLSTLLDTIADNISERFRNHPDEFSNDDLLNYLTTIQNTIDKTTKNIESIDEIPPITMNQINVNVEDNSSQLNRESREKVTDAVRKIMERLSKLTTDEKIVDETTLNETDKEPPKEDIKIIELNDEEDS